MASCVNINPAAARALIEWHGDRERTKRGIFQRMHARKIRVENGRIKLDEPTDCGA